MMIDGLDCIAVDCVVAQQKWLRAQMQNERTKGDVQILYFISGHRRVTSRSSDWLLNR